MMAEFEPALEIVLEHEGLYDNDPDDPGGETVRGIARKRHPEWRGWELVDWLKSQYPDQPQFLKALADSAEISRLVYEFYRAEFWDKLNVGHLANQKIANKVFDTAVDCGLGFASCALQEAMGYCGVPVQVDGIIGPKTIEVANICQGDAIYGEYKEVVAQHYRELADKNRRLAKYLKGWLKRAYS